MVKLTDIIGTDIKLVEKQQGNTNAYAKYLLPHMITHYELFVRTTRGSRETYDLTLEQLLAYHVYGDYVLVAKDGKTKLSYNDNTGNGVNGVTGIYEPATELADIKYKNEEIKWLEEEIQRGSSGVRLMLPSMGTQVVSTFGFGNISESFRKYLEKTLMSMNSYLSSNDEPSDPIYKTVNGVKEVADSDYILQRLAKDPELAPIIKVKVDAAVDEALEFRGMIELFLRSFVSTNVAKFALNDSVLVKSVKKLESEKKDALVEAVKAYYGYGPDDEVDLEYELFKVARITAPPEGETKFIVELTYNEADIIKDGVIVKFDHEDLKKTTADDEKDRFDTGVTTKKGKKYYREPDADTLAAYRLFLDKIYELQAKLYADQFDDKKEQTVPWYVSDRLIPSKKLKTMERYFPNIAKTFIEPEVKEKSIKKENSLIHKLCQHRLAITTMSLIAQRTLAFDKKMFDDFYNGDMLLKEINWLTAALTDWGRVVVEAEREGNPLAVVKGVPVGQDPRAPGNVVSIAEATRQLAIYRLEIPMLKQVINEYNSLYNAFTISNVFNMADGDPKEAQLAKALWGGITNRTVGIFDIPGVKPHVLFDRLFKEVSDVLSEKSSFGIDPYPPSWSDTQILGKLVRDPRYVLGDKPSIDDYKKYLKEYLEYLQSKFSSRWTVASAIISVVDNYRVSIATDADGLRKGFLKRIEGDAKKSTLKGRYIQFDAYGQLIAILRAQLSIPLDMREDFIAKGIDKELGLAIKDRIFDEKKPVFAKGHPDYKTPEKKEESKKVEDSKEPTKIKDAFAEALGPFGEPVEEVAEEEVAKEEIAEEVAKEVAEEEVAPEDIGDIVEDINVPPEGWDEANPIIPEEDEIDPVVQMQPNEEGELVPVE